MATFTFGLQYLQYPGGDLEEIDVAADSYGQARRQAEQIGRDGYQPAGPARRQVRRAGHSHPPLTTPPDERSPR